MLTHGTPFGRTFVCAGMTGIALAACSSMPGPAGGSLTGQAPSGCASGPSPVNITQVDVTSNPPTITVAPGELVLTTGGSNARWQIAGTTFSFTSNGVALKPSPPNPALPQIYNVTSSNQSFSMCLDLASSTAKSWQYTITFTGQGGTWSCDPTIVNGSTTPAAVASGAPQVVNCTKQ